MFRSKTVQGVGAYYARPGVKGMNFGPYDIGMVGCVVSLLEAPKPSSQVWDGILNRGRINCLWS